MILHYNMGKKYFLNYRKKTEMSLLWTSIRVRDELACAHSSATSGHPRAVPALLADVHAEQYGAPPHRAGASTRRAAARRAAPQPHAVSTHVHVTRHAHTSCATCYVAFCCATYYAATHDSIHIQTLNFLSVHTMIYIPINIDLFLK